MTTYLEKIGEDTSYVKEAYCRKCGVTLSRDVEYSTVRDIVFQKALKKTFKQFSETYRKLAKND